MDYNIKNALYASVGVREYRIVDPAKERTTIYYYEQDAAPMSIPFHQEVISGIYKNLKIKIADLITVSKGHSSTCAYTKVDEWPWGTSDMKKIQKTVDKSRHFMYSKEVRVAR